MSGKRETVDGWDQTVERIADLVLAAHRVDAAAGPVSGHVEVIAHVVAARILMKEHERCMPPIPDELVADLTAHAAAVMLARLVGVDAASVSAEARRSETEQWIREAEAKKG